MSIPKHLMEAKLCNLDICKLSNTIPNDKDLLNMVAHLVVENANMQRKINQAIEYIDKQKKKMYKSRNKIAMFILMKLENILQNGSDSQ